MNIKFTPIIKTSYPEVGQLFKYEGYDDYIYMRITNYSENGTRCVLLKDGSVQLDFRKSDIVLLRQLNDLQVAPA